MNRSSSASGSMLAPSSPSVPTTPANRHEVAQFAKQGGFGDEERDMLQAQGLDDDMGGDHQAGGGVSPVYGPPEVLSTEEEQASPTFPKKWDVYVRLHVHLRAQERTEEERCCACIRLMCRSRQLLYAYTHSCDM